MNTTNRKILQLSARTILFLILCSIIFRSSASAISLSATTQVTVGATYYGGEYNGGHWVIDNNNQCTRIANGEFTAASLGAVVDSSCDDDNGLTYQNDIPLHNTVSFAELSNNPSASDYAAMGGLAAGTRVEIEYHGRCVVAEKRDVGQGGSSVNGHLRAIDLWWQTARSLGFTNGFDAVKVRLAGSASLSPLGKTSACKTAAAPKPKPAPQPVPTPETPQPIAEVEAAHTNVDEQPIEQKPSQPKRNVAVIVAAIAIPLLVACLGVLLLIRLRKRPKKSGKKTKRKSRKAKKK